jgi:anti-sigma-K factor RskA
MAGSEHEPHTLAGAYVMDAVTDSERIQFAAHLAGCAECHDEVRELQEATARLGTAMAVRPRPALKDPVIRAAHRTSQLPPVIQAAATARGGTHGSDRPGRRAASRASGSTARPGQVWQRLTALPRSALVAAAILTASAAVTAVTVVATHHMAEQLDHSQRQSDLIATVLTAPDVVMLTDKVRTGGTATVVMSHREHALVFTAHGLRPLPATKSYELWLMGPDGVRPIGMLKAVADGMTEPAVVSGVAVGDIIALTVEPADGSPQPTSAPIVTIGRG